jgi:DNA polymerase
MRGTSPDPEARSEAGPVETPPGDDEPPPWTDADLTGLPMDDAQSVPDWGPADAEVTTPAEEANPVARLGWDALERAVAGCRACRLCERRTNTVFGVGDRNADLMLIGEGPGQDEDRQGEPFVGRAGQLLNRMLAAVGLRREQVYIANVVKCRPPNNRNPQPDEAAACRPYLARQIELVAPRLIVSLGGVSAQSLLDSTESVGRLRGRVHHYGPDRIPLLVTYHPSYYLRSPAEKAKGWQDLQRMIRLLNGEDAG